MHLTEKQLDDIAQDLEMGMDCFIHKSKEEVISFPNLEENNLDLELWKDLLEKVNAKPDEYIRVSKMTSKESFKIMEDFAQGLPEKEREKVLSILSQKSPFRNFKIWVDESTFRQDWFDFRRKSLVDYVRNHL